MLEKVFAQTDNINVNDPNFPGSKLELDQLLSGSVNLFLGVIAFTAFAGLLYSGFLYITSAGDVAKAERARKNIVWALIGIILAVLSYFIVRLVAGIVPGETTGLLRWLT